MLIKRLVSMLLFLVMLLSTYQIVAAQENTPYTLSAPALVKPGHYAELSLSAPVDTTMTLYLYNQTLETVHTIIEDYPVTAGENMLRWNGTIPGVAALPVGEHVLKAVFGDSESCQTKLRIGVPYPQLTGIQQSGTEVSQDNHVTVTFRASEAGQLLMRLFWYETDQILGETSMPVEAGLNQFSWDGMLDGARVQEGEYALVFTLRRPNGEESMQHYVFIEVGPQSLALVDFDALTDQLLEQIQPQPQLQLPTQQIILSPPYSTIDDGTFWSMTPGEVDDAVIWEIMMQPITVYDDGRIRASGHVFMKEFPDGTGENVAQIHGLSQGIHVIGEVNEYGYVLCEVFSNYDPSYTPITEAEKFHAFDLRRGYLLAENLKTVEVQPDIGLLIDKLTQRMYVFIDGVRVTELLVSTGKITNEKYYRETVTGEFITISHTGGFWSNDLYSDYAIRYNGGSLLHETPCIIAEDGTRYYGVSENYLGTKRSANCVRLPYRKNEEGFNAAWFWKNLSNQGGYKILIWDDHNRYDTPTTWR